MRRYTFRRVAMMTIVLACCATSQGQNMPGYWAGDVSLAPTVADNLNQPARAETETVAKQLAAGAGQSASGVDLAIPIQTRQALGFYGGRSALATLNELPRSTAYQSAESAAPLSTRRTAKPFQNAANRPTLSPYLNLFRDDKSSNGIPNYYNFVQPQLEQQAAGQRQQIQSQRRERQGQATASSGARAQSGVAVRAGSTAPAHFMDTAQYYGAWRR